MKIYIFRHAKTEWNKRRKFQGMVDIPISDDGMLHMQRVAQNIQDIPFDYVISSPLKRAIQTADILIGEKDVPFVVDSRVREVGFGVDEGTSQIPGKFWPFNRYFKYNYYPEKYVPATGGESLYQVIERARSFLYEVLVPIEKEGMKQNVMVVTHGGWICGLMVLLGKNPMSQYWEKIPGNGSVTILNIDDGIVRIIDYAKELC